jgi:DNA topoisomerase-1
LDLIKKMIEEQVPGAFTKKAKPASKGATKTATKKAAPKKASPKKK